MNCRYLTALACQVGVLSLLVSACGCSHPHGHTPDAVLRKNFDVNEPSFIALRDMVLEDRDYLTISTRYVITRTRTASSPPADLDLVGMSKERYSRYLEVFHAVGLDWVGHGDGGVTFRMDGPSFANGDSTKGYVYSLVDLVPCVDDLDSYVPPRRDRPWSVYSRLREHWYLYLEVG